MLPRLHVLQPLDRRASRDPGWIVLHVSLPHAAACDGRGKGIMSSRVAVIHKVHPTDTSRSTRPLQACNVCVWRGKKCAGNVAAR
jgi:hypothetical protein